MNARTITQAVGRGITAVAPIVGISMALTLFVVGLAVTPAWAEVGTRLQKERSRTESQKPSDKTSYLHVGGAQFFGPPPPEKASTDDGIRFIHTDPHLHDGHRPYHDVHQHANIADGGALMFNWTFDSREVNTPINDAIRTRCRRSRGCTPTFR